MKCPACETDLRVDARFVSGDGLLEVVVVCQNDRDRTDQCIPETNMLLSFHGEDGCWVLRDYGD